MGKCAYIRFKSLLLVVLLAVSACKQAQSLRALGGRLLSADRAQPPFRFPGSGVRWKGVLMTGDDSIPAFDNARQRLRSLWIAGGVAPGDIRELSMSAGQQTAEVRAASATGLERALKSLQVGSHDGCMVHLTSHGAPWGFYLRDQKPLSPAALDALLTAQCGTRPTVVFIAACYSGVFAGNIMARPNRAVFTAARDDRTSFGCGVEDQYTFWDGCMIEQLPKASSWGALKSALETCIRAKERHTGLHFSYPQARIGRLFEPAVSPSRGGGA